MKNIIVGFSFFCLASINSYALTGTELKKHLIDFNSTSSSPWGPYGVGYVLGVTDAANGFLFCAPVVTNKELTSVVLSYLFAHPEKLEKTADILVSNALAAKWPCKKGADGSVRNPAPKSTPKPIPKPDSPF